MYAAARLRRMLPFWTIDCYLVVRSRLVGNWHKGS